MVDDEGGQEATPQQTATPRRMSMQDLLGQIGAMQANQAMGAGEDEALPPMPTEPAQVLFPINSNVVIMAGHHKIFKQGSWGTVTDHSSDGVSMRVSFKRINNPKHVEKLPIDGIIPKNVVRLLKDDEPKPGLQRVLWDHVILPDTIKKAVAACALQSEHFKTKFAEWGLAETSLFEYGIGATALFDGPPGTGKTLLAKALGWELQKEVLIANTGTLQDCRVGEFEKNVAALFQKAQNQNCMILFDEADSLVSSRDLKGPILSAETNFVLSEIEKFDGVCIFTTNRIEDLDEAVERRITLKLEIPEPDEEMRKRIWHSMIPAKCPLEPDVELDMLAQAAMTGGMIKNVVVNAVKSALFDKSEKITAQHFMDAMAKEVDAHRRFQESRKRRGNRHIISGMPGASGGSGFRERLSDFAVNIGGRDESA